MNSSSGRVWRKVPESDAKCVQQRATILNRTNIRTVSDATVAGKPLRDAWGGSSAYELSRTHRSMHTVFDCTEFLLLFPLVCWARRERVADGSSSLSSFVCWACCCA